MKYIYTIVITLTLVFLVNETKKSIEGDFPVEYFDKYVSCPKCEECFPPTKCTNVKIEGGKIYPDNKHYLDTIKALNFRISDLKSCISEECLNFSSMPSKCK